MFYMKFLMSFLIKIKKAIVKKHFIMLFSFTLVLLVALLLIKNENIAY